MLAERTITSFIKLRRSKTPEMERLVVLFNDVCGVALSDRAEVMTAHLSQQMMPEGVASREAIQARRRWTGGLRVANGRQTGGSGRLPERAEK